MKINQQLDDARLQNTNLNKLNDDLKKENDAQTQVKFDLEEKISELELLRLESQRQNVHLQSQKDDALQGQESYKALLKRIQMQRNVSDQFHSPYSFGDKESPERKTVDQLLTTTKTQKNMVPKESNAFNQARDVLGPKRNSHDADKISISSFYKDNKSDMLEMLDSSCRSH